MNYRHAYHAGNFCDVAKHAALCLLLEHFRLKDKPFAVIDTHAGTGLYDLGAEEAQKTQEAQAGILSLDRALAPHELLPYLAALDSCRKQHGTLWYPGSPWLARHYLRPHDRLVLCEKHPEDSARLRRNMRHDARLHIHARDGYAALPGLVPPPERRGMVLIDPPYEAPDEWAQATHTVLEAYARWPAATYVLWYPLKDRPSIWKLHEDFARAEIDGVLVAECRQYAATRTDTLLGGGLLILNPPWQMDEKIRTLYTALPAALCAPEGGAEIRWLRPPR